MINMMRMIAIALPVMMLMACGGGGGGGSATAPTPTTPQALPDALITDPAAARNLITDSTAPTATVAQAQQTFQSRITDADRFIVSDGWLVSPRIQGGATVSTGGGIMIDDFTFQVTLAEIRMSVEDRFDLTRFNSQYAPVMDYRGVTLAEYRAAGRDGNDVYEYQSYGGWLASNAFSVDMLTINGGTSNEHSLLIGISYGEESGSRPSLSSPVIRWRGSLVGLNRGGDLIQGDAELTWGPSEANIVSVNFAEMKNLSSGANIADVLTWIGQDSVPLATDGTFESANGDIKGSFYGSGYEEVGGVFNRNNIIGAFGAVRE